METAGEFVVTSSLRVFRWGAGAKDLVAAMERRERVGTAG